MLDFDASNWLTYLLIAVVAFVVGRVSAGASRSDSVDRVTRRQNEENDAREIWRSLSAQGKSQVDEFLAARKIIEAVKVIRNETGAELKLSKQVVDMRGRNELV